MTWIEGHPWIPWVQHISRTTSWSLDTWKWMRLWKRLLLLHRSWLKNGITRCLLLVFNVFPFSFSKFNFSIFISNSFCIIITPDDDISQGDSVSNEPFLSFQILVNWLQTFRNVTFAVFNGSGIEFEISDCGSNQSPNVLLKRNIWCKWKLKIEEENFFSFLQRSGWCRNQPIDQWERLGNRLHHTIPCRFPYEQCTCFIKFKIFSFYI